MRPTIHTVRTGQPGPIITLQLSAGKPWSARNAESCSQKDVGNANNTKTDVVVAVTGVVPVADRGCGVVGVVVPGPAANRATGRSTRAPHWW